MSKVSNQLWRASTTNFCVIIFLPSFSVHLTVKSHYGTRSRGFDTCVQEPSDYLILRLHISWEAESNYLRDYMNICGSNGIAGGECESDRVLVNIPLTQLLHRIASFRTSLCSV